MNGHDECSRMLRGVDWQSLWGERVLYLSDLEGACPQSRCLKGEFFFCASSPPTTSSTPSLQHFPWTPSRMVRPNLFMPACANRHCRSFVLCLSGLPRNSFTARMPALHLKALQRRADNSGRTFSIIFAFIALLVVLACLIWGIILPKFRKKNTGLPTTGLTTTQGADDISRQFPSHPALLRSFSKKSSTKLRHYDPRTESPFPNSPSQSQTTTGHPVLLSQLKPAPILGATSNSHGLFTPAKDRLPSRHGFPLNQEDHFKTGSGVGSADLGTAAVTGMQDYILPVPEPLVLKPRPAGRPPPLTRQLERFPMPIGNLDRRGGLVHPVKLFQELEQRDSRVTSDIFGTPCPGPCHTNHYNPKHISVLEIAIQDPASSPNERLECYTSDKSSTSLTNENTVCQTANRQKFMGLDMPKRAMGTNVPEHSSSLERAGTVTRPKTPVSEIREWFDRAASDSKVEYVSLKRGWTSSTNPFTTPGLSSTPPTSPLASSKIIAGLSTPLRPPRASVTVPASAPHEHRRTPSSAALPSAQKSAAAEQFQPAKIEDQPDRRIRHASIFSKRTQGLVLNPISFRNARESRRHTQRHSLSSLSAAFTHRNKQAQRASSMYSRDTKGLSLVERTAVQKIVDATADMAPQMRAPSGEWTGSVRRKTGWMDMLKSKIDAWDLHTGDLDGSVFTPATLKKLPNFGPRGPALCGPSSFVEPKHIAHRKGVCIQGKSVPKIRIRQFDEDIFGGRASTLADLRPRTAVPQSDVNMTKPAILGTPEQGTAPGGGDWI